MAIVFPKPGDWERQIFHHLVYATGRMKEMKVYVVSCVEAEKEG